MNIIILDIINKYNRINSYNKRFLLVFLIIITGFALVTARIIIVANTHLEKSLLYQKKQTFNIKQNKKRPDIKDRNLRLLATNLEVTSLYATPYLINDISEVEEKLIEIIPQLKNYNLAEKLDSNKKFVWIKRALTQIQKQKIFQLGLPWLKFKKEIKRVYPAGNMMAHVIGYTDINNKGIQGIEAFIDRSNIKKDLVLSIDSDVNYIACSEIKKAVQTYQAKSAAVVMMNIYNGEIIVFCSIPDFNPNEPKTALEKKSLNRINAAVFEFGSIMKIFTYAMEINNAVQNNQKIYHKIYDISKTINVKGFKVRKLPSKYKFVNMQQGFITSNNLVAAKIAIEIGKDKHKQFLQKFGIFDKVNSEIKPEQKPIVNPIWDEVTSVSVAFGYGIAITPLQFITAAAILLNGGNIIQPTFIKEKQYDNNSNDKTANSKTVNSKTASRETANSKTANSKTANSKTANSKTVSRKTVSRKTVSRKTVSRKIAGLEKQTVEEIRRLLRLNVLQGTARKLAKLKIKVGGKTGTSQKIINGKYSNEKVLTSFLSLFPMQKPKYAMLVLIDEPKSSDEHKTKQNTASYNAVPVSANIIKRLGTWKEIANFIQKDNKDNYQNIQEIYNQNEKIYQAQTNN